MITETYRGRKLKARKGSEWGTILVTCNGEPVSWPTGSDLRKALDSVKAQIDGIDLERVNGDRWGAHWYAPGSYEMCPEGIHPQERGGQCQHFTCVARRAAAPAQSVTYLPGGCHEHADGEIVTNSECHQPEIEALSDAEAMRRTCDDCGAEPGTECTWSCSSRWT